MPRLNQSLPRYRKHKASGQAVVHLSGQDFYLGPQAPSHLAWNTIDVCLNGYNVVVPSQMPGSPSCCLLPF